MNTLNLSLTSRVRPTVLRIALAAALIPLTAALPAHAGNAPADGQPLQTLVRYADLNLDSDAGTLVLYQRISSAAKEVCPDVDSRNLQVWQTISACRVDAMARAVLQIDSPRLTAMQAEQVKHSRPA